MTLKDLLFEVQAKISAGQGDKEVHVDTERGHVGVAYLVIEPETETFPGCVFIRLEGWQA